MDNILYVGLSQQTALQRQMDVVANNLANMNTTGFKRESVLFQQYVKDGADATASGSSEDDIAFVFDYGVARNFSPGAYIQTGNSLDVAVTNKGFLMVEAENGDTMYTRNGHMSIMEDGTLVTSSGHPILDDGGAPITITAADRQITIAKDGTVSGKQGIIAKLGIVEFAPQDEPSLEKGGESLFTSTATPQPAVAAQVLQGMVEGSNVEPIKEMTSMMQISRTYQRTAKMLEQYQDMQNQSIQRLAKVQ
jgi:flagellar basal-body rod protein FlgF